MKNLSLHDHNIKDILIKQNESFKLLSRKHEEFDQRLRELNNQRFKTDYEWLEVRNLKKQKLRVKDSMQKYIFEYRKSYSAHQERI